MRPQVPRGRPSTLEPHHHYKHPKVCHSLFLFLLLSFASSGRITQPCACLRASLRIQLRAVSWVGQWRHSCQKELIGVKSSCEIMFSFGFHLHLQLRRHQAPIEVWSYSFPGFPSAATPLAIVMWDIRHVFIVSNFNDKPGISSCNAQTSELMLQSTFCANLIRPI